MHKYVVCSRRAAVRSTMRATLEIHSYIWIPATDINLPSLETSKRIEWLSWKEVYEITAFLSTYHEQFGYMLGNARLKVSMKNPRSSRRLFWQASVLTLRSLAMI